MIEEESYSALYLYNALIEYIYFLIILIQDKGPNDLDNIAKHVRFFKKDVYTFIQIFNGKNLTEKVSRMLCSTTSVFEIKDNLLHLTNNYTYFKQIIYEDLLVSKVADLILRGICKVHDICHNLNLSSVIVIKEDILIAMLKYYPYFHFDSESSVILLQFHGLVGFDKHIYHTTVKYFQSYLQNINVLTYKDVKLHSSCIPSCTAKNCIVIFCILHISPFFKCKNGKLSLRNGLKRKRHCKQVIDMEKLESKISSESFTIGLLVYKALGHVISSWTGEVSSLSNCAGLIQSVVNFTNGHQGVFIIYFYKTALKYACEVGDLRQFLNICDVLEFDAEFCSETTNSKGLWQATRIKVTKHVLKDNKYELNPDTEKYMENVHINYHNFKPLLKVCSIKNCQTEYTVLEKENTNNNKEFGSSRFTIKNISTKQEQKESKVSLALNVVPFFLNKDSCVKDINEIELACNHLATFTQIKPSISQDVPDNNLEDSLKVNFEKLPKNCTEENVFHDRVVVPHKIAISLEDKNENEILNIVTIANKTANSLQVKNDDEHSTIHTKLLKEFSEQSYLVNAVAIPIEVKNDKYSILRPKLPKEFSEENELLNAVVLNEVKNGNKYSVIVSKLPRKFSEENATKETTIPNEVKNEEEFSEESELPHMVAATKTTTISHELKNSAKYAISHPKEFSKENDFLNVAAISKDTIIPHKVKNEADYSIIHPMLPKTCSKINGFINVVAVPNETVIPHEVKNMNKNSVVHPDLVPNMFNTSTFLLGEVVFISTCDGVAHSSFKNNPCKIFFKKDDICFQTAGNVLMKGNRVLLFIPYVELGELVLIATLVYPLTSEEIIETQKNNFSIQDFIVDHFSQKVKKYLCDTWVCDCDISKSLLVGTQLGPYFKNHTTNSLKCFKFIQKLHELYRLTDETCRSLCSLVNQMCAQKMGEIYRKLLAQSPFSLAKSLSWIRYSKDHTLYKLKKKFVNRHKFNAKKHRLLSFVDAHKKDSDNTGSIFSKESNIPTIFLKSSSLEEQCSVDGNCNVVNLNMPNKNLLTKDSAMKQSCHESCSSVSSFSSCLDDSTKELSDDVFYSCESDLDSRSTVLEDPPLPNKSFCKSDGNLFTALNRLNDKSFTSSCGGLEQNGFNQKRCQKYRDTSLYLKPRHFSLSKHRRNKRKVILPSKKNFCKTCYQPPIETTAEITVINKSHLYFKVDDKQQNVTLAFPKCLIPIEMKEKIKLKSIIKITMAPHKLMNLSQVLYVDF